VVHRRIAVTVDAIEADAELLAFAKALAHVDMAAKLRIRHVRRGQARERLVACALWNQVHGAAHRSARRHAVEQGRRPFQHLDALEHLGRRPVVRRNAVQAAHRDIADAGTEPADGIVFADDAGHAGAEDRGVRGRDHVGDVARLTVFDEFFRVADGAERRLHEVLVAQHADAAAGRDLPAGIGLRQGSQARALHRDGRHHRRAFRPGVRPGQRVAAVGGAHGTQPLPPQQFGKAFSDAERPVQALTALALKHLRVHGHFEPGLRRIRVKRHAQRAGRHVERLPRGRVLGDGLRMRARRGRHHGRQRDTQQQHHPDRCGGPVQRKDGGRRGGRCRQGMAGKGSRAALRHDEFLFVGISSLLLTLSFD